MATRGAPHPEPKASRSGRRPPPNLGKRNWGILVLGLVQGGPKVADREPAVGALAMFEPSPYLRSRDARGVLSVTWSGDRQTCLHVGRDRHAGLGERANSQRMYESDSHASMPPGALPDPPPNWREFLTDGTGPEVVHRLIDGDPFSMRVRIHDFISREGFFVNPEALFLRGATRLAVEARSLDAGTEFPLWCSHVIETACHELLEEQFEEELRHVPNGASKDGEFYRALAALFSVEPELGRYTCMRLNRLNRRGRQAVAAIGLAGVSIEEFARLEGCSVDEGRHAFKTSLKTVLDAVNGRRNQLFGPGRDNDVD